MSRLLLFVALVDAGALNELSLVQRWNAAVSEFEVEDAMEAQDHGEPIQEFLPEGNSHGF